MSRGGRGGRPSNKRGPDLSWDDEEPSEPLPNSRTPGPLFPERYLPTPKPLSSTEKTHITTLLNFRNTMRRGPLYAVVDPSSSNNNTSSKTKGTLRAGFDPFADQERYTQRYHRKKRTLPDLSERGGYTLRLFPLELWPVLDPKRKMVEWEGLSEEVRNRVLGGAGKKGKRKKGVLKFEEEDGAEGEAGKSASEDEDGEGGRKKKRREKGEKQKKGLDAEDEFPDAEREEEDGEGGQEGEEVADSEFGTDEEEDDGADDYNAEQYFDDGADDMDGGGGDGDDGDGGGGGGGYY